MLLLTKVALGSTLASLLALAAVTVSKNHEISQLEKQVTAEQTSNAVLRFNNLTLSNNQAVLEAGVSACSASVDAMAAQSKAMERAGVTALAEVNKAGAAVATKVKQINAMPQATCDDALAILKEGGKP
jgi:hypothetical protein